MQAPNYVPVTEGIFMSNAGQGTMGSVGMAGRTEGMIFAWKELVWMLLQFW